MTETLLVIVVLLAVAIIVLQFVLLARGGSGASREDFERLTRELRGDIADGRREAQDAAQKQRIEVSARFAEFSQPLLVQMTALTETNEQRLREVRNTLESKLKDLQTENASKLDEMRKTVDEKLHVTLELRLGESFKQVSDRLEQVHRGLGEMQSLAAGVGDLKKVLTNVKTRGTWGEVQLENLLEQILIPSQYDKNVITRPGSNERVEFAIRLPGRDADGAPCLLPIDAKFPLTDYQQLVDAQERGDPVAVELHSKALERRIKDQAADIHGKYVAPPYTTDFALLYLPVEGLYAEVLRRPGLADSIQRDFRVNVAGPTTLAAMLNSLQMGFRTLAIEQRSSEVWTLLSIVKTEFAKFGEILTATRKKLEEATNSIGKA